MEAKLMAVTQYDFAINDTANDLVQCCGLSQAIYLNEVINVDIDHVTADTENPTVSGSLKIFMASELTAGQQTELASLVAAHDGTCPDKTVFIESDQILGSGYTVTGDSEWEVLGGQPTSVNGLLLSNGFELTDKQYFYGRITCEIKTSEAGPQFDIKEYDPLASSGVSLLSAVEDLPSTSGEWHIYTFTSDVEPHGEYRTYCFEGRLNGAASLEVRRAAITLLYTGP
jgi:hypothetical protein